MRPAAWFGEEGPHTDVVLSSRVRIMRNLRGRKFPHASSSAELEDVLDAVASALSGIEAPDSVGSPLLERQEPLSPTARDYLVACRLVSPEFAWKEAGRAVFLDARRRISLMVNEEDHVRLQALTPGWSPGDARSAARSVLDALEDSLDAAHSPRFGFLSASPYNCGTGVRTSAMFHLIGLAHTKRLRSVLSALAGRGLTARGLFGESSRALGAFVQVSTTSGSKEEFLGTGGFLIAEERSARAEVDLDSVQAKVEETLRFVQSHAAIGIGDACRAIGWIRWGAVIGMPGIAIDAKAADRLFATMNLGTQSSSNADRVRASALRDALCGC